MENQISRRYTKVRDLGSGAQGSVSLVADRYRGGRLVALKSLSSRGDVEWLKLFKREFEVLAQLRHPRLARVHDFGTTADGRAFFTRDYVPGDDFRERTSGMDVLALLAAAVDVCRALEPLHRCGLVHGDLKPGNVIVGGDGVARLIDFSFVRTNDEGGGGRGTLQYIAPELLEEKSADARADLYSLGAMLFEAASGEPLFEGTAREIVAGHLGDARPAPRPDRIAIRGAVDGAAWRGLAGVISRLVERQPEARYPSIEEVEAALTAIAPAAIAPDPVSEIPALPSAAGREAETRRVREKVLGRLSEPKGRGALYAVEGEVGAGKSAVLADVKWHAQLSGYGTIEAVCSRGGGPVAPIIALAEQIADLQSGDSADAARAEALVAALRSLAAGRAELDTIAVGLGRAAARAAQKRPLLVLVDDLDQAADEAAALLRGLMAGAGSDTPLAVLVACRTGHPWKDRIGRGDGIALPLLDRAAIRGLAAAYFGAVSDEKVDRILAHTGGNPLFVGSLLFDVAKRGGGLERLERLGPPVELGEYWRQRVASLGEGERRAVEAIAVLGGSAAPSTVAQLVGVAEDRVEPLLASLETMRLLNADASGLRLSSGSLAAEVLAAGDPGVIAALHAQAAELETDEARRLLHAALAKDAGAIRRRYAEVAAGLERAGALAAAQELLAAVAAVLTEPPEAALVRLGLGRIALAQGDHATAALHLKALVDEPAPVGMEALALLGKMHGARRELVEAAEALDRALERAACPADTARILAELAQVQFRRGELDLAADAARRGLDLAPRRDPTRAELYGVLGKIAAARGDLGGSAAHCTEAVEAARASGDRRALGLAINMLAWARQQAGDLAAAAEDLATALALYREMGDLRRLMRAEMMAGDLHWWLDRQAEALVHHEEAMRLAAAVGNPVQEIEVRVGLGQALAKVGRFERAALLLVEAREDAARLKQEGLGATATAFLGDVAACRGNTDEALALWSEARAAQERVGKAGVCAELELEMAELELGRGTADGLAAAKRLAAAAAGRAREDRGRNFEGMLALVRGAILVAEGRFDEGMRAWDELGAGLTAHGSRELLWQVHAAAARALLDRGAEMLARQRLRTAERILEQIAAELPSEHRLPYWQDVRRAEIRRLLAVTVPSSAASLARGAAFAAKPDELDPEAAALYRVLECNKRISSETNHDHLLEAILDAAIEMTGAERGFVLTRCGEGLDVGAAREIGRGEPRDPHEQFSRSIAESVCLDGEPVVTVDAAGDERFSEFLSIHALKVKSVACVPVNYRGTSFGVLYLENRLRRGRFGARDLRVLTAFADQVAIAIAHTRLLDEARRREEELAQTTRALEEVCARQAADLKSRKTDLRLVEEKLERVRERLEGRGDYHGLVGAGDAMGRVFAVVERVKDLDLPVVVVGESGTGKDLVARVLHDVGARRNGPFVVLSCGGVPETLVEATLFGHGRGAFSGADAESPGLLAAAASGTLYLDDVGEMTARMQVDLLRVLQEGSFVPLGKSEPVRAQCRFVASSRVPLEALVERGRLRQDLYYRLGVVAIELPPLRERREDIPSLARCIAHREAERLGRPDPGLDASALEALAAHPWPGNVRELEQLLRRALVVDDETGPLTADRLFGGAAPLPQPIVARRGKIAAGAEAAERDRYVEALEASQWNRSLAAQKLGVPRRTFYRRLETLGLLKGK
ncbi:MAG: sigma 54-interacting transcriptional regulator [Proteobacteria bacterium]|nr:sigma 54-interacting transcriptional regulator [Pseudomonadota bacterium]